MTARTGKDTEKRPLNPMRIGLDLDNTIVGYDHVFASAAKAMGQLPETFSGGKCAVKEALIAGPEGETAWMRVQGRVYGAYMSEAVLMEGVEDFLGSCRRNGADIHIVSHKTRFGHFDPDRIDLRKAAIRWLEGRGFFSEHGFGLTCDQVRFADTRVEKVNYIAELGCDLFVDDLPEVFLEPGFPNHTRAILLRHAAGPCPQGEFEVCRSWGEIRERVFGR